MKILVTGATGYIGRHLTEKLLSEGHEVNCMVRDASRAPAGPTQQCRTVQADALQPETLLRAVQGVEVAYYLIHSMSGRDRGFEERDRRAACNFARAAKQAGVQRIIYLGGLATAASPVSSHLKSRHETGAVLRQYGPPLIEFRAGIIVGNGSTSFEIVRCLTERLPVMICPRWVTTRTQPIAIDDVLAYLAAALGLRTCIEEPVEIGGATVETFQTMMLGYAHQRKLRRFLLRVPVLTPRLSSYWLDLVTPFPPALTRPLVEGMRSESVCTTTLAAHLFPEVRPISYEAAVAEALKRSAPTLPLPPAVAAGHRTVRAEGVICGIRECTIHASRDQVFGLLQTVGGGSGWFYSDSLWRLRGLLDQLVGGVGMSRGRSRATGMLAGDVIDFWRVERVEAPRSLLLRAEMRIPGAAWLQFDVRSASGSETVLRCCAWFQPRGLSGELYWSALYLIHVAIFKGMVMRIRERAELLSA